MKSKIHTSVQMCLHALVNFCRCTLIIILFGVFNIVEGQTNNFKPGPEILLDDFNTAEGWKIIKSDGVSFGESLTEGIKGKAIKLEYDFAFGTGYGGIQKNFPLDLPDNFQFTFYIKAESPGNNLEFKLIDSTGQNVWWSNSRGYKFPAEWTKIKIKKRNINFAWGPTEDKSLKKIRRIEFTIASNVGGKGTVYIDSLRFEPLPPEDNSPVKFEASSSSEIIESPYSGSVKNINDGNINTEWKSYKLEDQDVVLFLDKRRELGGIVIDWDKDDYAEDFDIYLSEGKEWNKTDSVRGHLESRSYIRLKDQDALSIKIKLLKSSKGNGYGIKEISVKNLDYSADINRFFINISKDNPRGYFPRYLNEEATFWTITGVNSDVKEAMINEDGMVEVDKSHFSIEPFLSIDGKLITWNDIQKEQTLEKKYLPIPSVTWKYNNLLLETKIFTAGEANKNSVLYLMYKLKNNSPEDHQVSKSLPDASRVKGNLYLTLRPFQVYPYYQSLNITGGAANVSSINYDKGKVFVNNDKVIIPVTKEDAFGATTFDEGDIISFLSKNIVPHSKEVNDKKGFASGCLSYSFDLAPGEEKTIYLAVPFYKYNTGKETINEEVINKLLSETIDFWENKTNHIKFSLPESAQKIINTYRSNLAYILINRDKAGIQPGSRAYERSWIRDGSLTSSALLKSGIVDEVREFINWYSSYQYKNGKVPCVVDFRGPDPVAENDSHGEFIYLIKQFFNFTKDTSFLASKNSNVVQAVAYMKELIAQRSTTEFRNTDSLKRFYGILPESISHEGYSAKPMHSYWDDFFAMKGLKDAVEIQKILGETKNYKSFSIMRDEFKKNLYNSINLAIAKTGIDYIPGCAELGDFDATSTTIAIYPCNELRNLPQPYGKNTFEKYYRFFENRKNPSTEWINYTPYEVRTIGSFIFLDEKEKAQSLLQYFLKDQRPQGWNDWAEVVWKNERTPQTIGDMPHTWVSSDFINAIRAMFVYENEYDSSLVIGAGLYQEWITDQKGISVANLPTYYGELAYSIIKDDNLKNNKMAAKDGEKYILKIAGKINPPPGGIILRSFNESKMPKKVLVNKKDSKDFSAGKIVIREFPASVEIIY